MWSHQNASEGSLQPMTTLLACATLRLPAPILSETWHTNSRKALYSRAPVMVAQHHWKQHTQAAGAQLHTW